MPKQANAAEIYVVFTKDQVAKFKEAMEGFSVVFDNDDDAVAFMAKLKVILSASKGA